MPGFLWPRRGESPALRLLAIVALAALAAIAGGPAPAQDGPAPLLPERRAVVEAGVDLYGGDLRSIFATSLPICRDACLAEPECRAFTFNLAAGACFLKSGAGERTPFANAVSAEIVAASPEAVARAAARAPDLAFLPEPRRAAARQAALAPGLGVDAGALAPETAAAVAALAAAAGRSDAAADWAALAAFALADLPQDWAPRQALLTLAASAATNAYLRAPDAAAAAAAARDLARALETDGEGRLALDALRLAERLAPGPEIAAEVARAEGLYGFRLLDRQVDFEAQSPRACFAFSEDLAAAGVDYADFVRVEPGPLPVEARERQICIDGLAHGARYAVTLRAGLPSAGGERLRASVAQEVYVRDRSASVRFAGRAYVLPKAADAAVPVVTVNLDEVALRLFRVGDRGLASVVRNGDFAGALNPFEERRLGDDLGEPVWEGRGETAGALNADTTTALPLGDVVAGLAPGLYALTARDPDRPREDWETIATQWFVVTDLGIATLKGADGLHVFAQALSSAAPLEGIALTLLARNNDVLGTAATDAAGHARFDPGLLRGRGGAEPFLVAAEGPDGDFAFLSLAEAGFDLSDRGVEGRPAPPPVDVFVATDRGAYRPGETVNATILARDATVDAIEGLPLTAIVTRPDGVEHGRFAVRDEGAGGRAFALALDADAQRGGWRLALHADPEAPALAAAGFLVEDFTPERLDLVLTLPEGPADPARGATLAAEAEFLWGAPAAEVALEGEVSIGLLRALPGHEGYVFGLEDEPFASGWAALPAGLAADADGRATIPLPLPEIAPSSRPRELVATLRARDGSGRPVERSLTRPLLPPEPLIGLRPLFEGAVDEGGTAAFEAIALGPDLARAALGPVGWQLVRIETTYQWYELDGDWRYEPIHRRERVADGTLELTADAPARLDLPVDWGRYELRLAATDGRFIATSLGFDAGWAGQGGGAETPDFLDVRLDRAAFAVGDTARLRIEARNPGQVRVAVLTDRLVRTQALAVEAGETVVELPVTGDWAPGAYVSATLVRPMDVEARRNPARAIGIAWAAVDPGARRLAVAFETPATAEPRTTLQAALRIDGLAPGERAFATISAVDLGILNLTGHAPPDPDGHYFGQRRLGVEMRDLYGRLIDGMAGNPGRVRSGGDGGGGFRAPPPTEELVAVFSGVIEADAEGRATTPVPFPDFNGAVRLDAVAWTATGVGEASAEVLVRDPVVVSASLPRFLAPGDRTRLRLDLAHAFGPTGPVTVAVAASDPGLMPDGPFSAEATLDERGRLGFDVPLAGTSPGDYGLTVTTLAPDGRTLTKRLLVAVRANDPVLARRSRIALAPGATFTLDAAAFAGLAEDGAFATLAAGPLAGFDVPGLLTALEAYPWGCTEQIVSRAMPLLYFAETAEALGTAPPEIRARIDEAIRRALMNQNGAGGFGLWAADGGQPWLDAYVADFLSRARAQGHAMPDRAFEAALGNLQNLVAAYGDFEAGGEDLAYALLVLAREGRAAIGDLRYYADARAEAFATPFALAQLGLALALAGDQPRADRMFRLAAEAALAGEPEPLWRADFGSGLRDAAGVLALVAEAGSEAADRLALAQMVTAPGQARSTQESLWTLLAAQALIGEARAGDVAVDGRPLGAGLRVGAAEAAAAPLAVTNGGTGETALVVTAFGVPTEPEPAQGDGYRIARALYTMEGAPADPAAVTLNERLVAVVTVTPERETEARLIVSDPLPAGFEIDNPNLLRAGETGQLAWLDADDVATHAEFRADRFAAAVDWSGSAPFRLAYVVRAVSPGSFLRPAASVEDMYRPAFRARTDAGRVEIAAGP